MSEIAILVPVLGRPQRAAEVFESALVASAEPHRMIFLCSPGDHDEIIACYETDAQVEVGDWEAGRGDWARKINYGLTLTDEPYVLLGADDLLFHDGWDIAALRVAEKGFGVIGTNDLGNATVMRGEHSTHPLCARAYAETWGTVDEPEKLLHEGYQHQWVDTELVQTAKVRGPWAFAPIRSSSTFIHSGPMAKEAIRASWMTPTARRYRLRGRIIGCTHSANGFGSSKLALLANFGPRPPSGRGGIVTTWPHTPPNERFSSPNTSPRRCATARATPGRFAFSWSKIEEWVRCGLQSGNALDHKPEGFVLWGSTRNSLPKGQRFVWCGDEPRFGFIVDRRPDGIHLVKTTLVRVGVRR